MEEYDDEDYYKVDNPIEELIDEMEKQFDKIDDNIEKLSVKLYFNEKEIVNLRENLDMAIQELNKFEIKWDNYCNKSIWAKFKKLCKNIFT